MIRFSQRKEKKHLKKWVVFIEDGYTKLMSPDGEVFSHEIEGTLENGVAENGTYTATFVVDIVADRKAALKKVKTK